MGSSTSARFGTRVVLVGAAVAAVAGTQAASAAGKSTTLRLTSTQIKDSIVQGVDIAASRDAQAGKTAGYDVTSCTVDPRTHLAACDFALARPGGLIIGRVKVDVTTGRGSGVVTGGTRRLAGAHGTVTVAPGAQGSSVITLTFRR